MTPAPHSATGLKKSQNGWIGQIIGSGENGFQTYRQIKKRVWGFLHWKGEWLLQKMPKNLLWKLSVLVTSTPMISQQFIKLKLVFTIACFNSNIVECNK